MHWTAQGTQPTSEWTMPVSCLQPAARCQHTRDADSVCLCFGKPTQSESFDNESCKITSCQRPVVTVGNVSLKLPEPPCSSMRPTWDSISLVKKKIWICPAPITYYHKSIQFHLPPIYTHVWHNYQIPHVHTPCAIDPGRALSYPLSIHQPGPSPSPSRPFISIGMREVK